MPHGFALVGLEVLEVVPLKDVPLTAEVEDWVTSERLETYENVATVEHVVSTHHLMRGGVVGTH
jgi:hypothetical protein